MHTSIVCGSGGSRAAYCKHGMHQIFSRSTRGPVDVPLIAYISSFKFSSESIDEIFWSEDWTEMVVISHGESQVFFNSYLFFLASISQQVFQQIAECRRARFLVTALVAPRLLAQGNHSYLIT